MRATGKIKELTREANKHIITRNLNRRLDIRILDFDMERRTVSFVYNSVGTFENAKPELRRIGHPVEKYTWQPPQHCNSTAEYEYSFAGE